MTICNSSLHQKIACRVGRLQLIVALVAQIARCNDDENVDKEELEAKLDELCGMASEYSTRWLDETADLLKTWYNREAGP